MAKKKKPEFIDRVLNPQKYPYIKNKDGSVSTHEMAAEVDENGNWSSNFGLEGKINKDTFITNLGLHHKLAEPLKDKCKVFIK